MKLILTEAEKKSASWLDLDDEALGKAVKANMFSLQKVSDDSDRLIFMSAAFLLCCAVSDTNADKFKQTITNLTSKGKSFGNWEIQIKRIS